MDGIDIAAIETDGYGHINHLGFTSAAHDPELRERLRSCLNQSVITEEIEAIARDFTLQHPQLIKNLLNDLNLSEQDIDIIGFHGQTIHHDPDNRITIQIGDGELLAQETGIHVAYDIRQNDVQSGGQGAPLIPVYHRALTLNAGMDLPVAVINIGGVGNITWISDNEMIAFDTGPGNAMIDDWIKHHTEMTYDKDGMVAANGTLDQSKLDTFLSLPYFDKDYPKSLDRNDFTSISVDGLSLEDGARTLTEMTIQSIALAVSQCPEQPKAIYITGGGRHNKTIMARLSEETGLPVQSTDVLGWNGDSMEAEGFAYMAVRSLLGEPISYPSTTGCPTPMTGGKIAKARKSSEAA